MSRFLRVLQSDTAVDASGFAIGFGSTFVDRYALENPLCSIFISSIFGGLGVIGANFVSLFVPPAATNLL
jgi:hypothetical protein